MTFAQFIDYHNGDGHPEETMVAKLCRHFGLSKWDCFRAVYYYTMCYNLIDPWRMLAAETPIPKDDIYFVTDRRWVGYGDRYERLLEQLSPALLQKIERCATTSQQYAEVSGWYYFARYTAYMFLEVWNYLYPEGAIDDFMPAFEFAELYTKGAVALTGGTYDRRLLESFMNKAKEAAGDTAFSIETSLCGYAKICKGTRYNGYYTDRMLSNTSGTKVGEIILKLL